MICLMLLLRNLNKFQFIPPFASVLKALKYEHFQVI